MYYKFSLGELEDIKEELLEIEEVLDDQYNILSNHINGPLDYMAGIYATKTEKELLKKANTIKVINEAVVKLQKKIDEIIEVIKNTKAVDNVNGMFVYEPEQLNKIINGIKSTLSMSNHEYRFIFELSQHYETWEHSITNKLDNPNANIFDAIEEIKQYDDEKVFRHNKKIMHGLKPKLKDAVGYNLTKRINNIDGIKNVLDELSLLDEIEHIGEIVIEASRFGDIPDGRNDVKYIDEFEVLLFELKKQANKILPDSILDILKKMKAGGTLVIDGAYITDEYLQNLRYYGFFNIVYSDGNYRVNLKYDSITEWARNNTKIMEDVMEKAMKNGLSGIYKYDKEKGKYYNYDVNGEKVYLPELPKGFTVLDDVMGPFSIGVDTISLLDAIESGKWENILGVSGEIAGGAIGAAVVASSVIDPPIEIPLIIYEALGSVVMSKKVGKLGEKIGAKLDNEIREGHIYWEENV